MIAALMTFIYAFAAGILAFALALAFSPNARRLDQTLCFAVIQIALLAHIMGELVIVSGAYLYVPHLVGAELAIRTALGPALLLYTRALTSVQPIRFGGRDWVALAGPALVCVIILPFSMLSAEEKLALVDPATRDPWHFRIALFTCTAGFAIFIVFTTVYLVAALRLQTRHRKEMMRQFANVERKSLDWLRNMLMVFSIAWLFLAMKQALWVGGISSPPFNLALAFVEMLSLAGFAFLGLQQPTLHFDPVAEAPSDSRVPILTDERMAKTADKLTAALHTDRLYARTDLSLRMLSDLTGVTKNHISETLSQHLDVNFFDFVNRCRINEAKERLVETDATVLTIGMDVGFNSRSTFNAAFKKHTGTTPSAYRVSMREPNPIALDRRINPASALSD